MAASSASSLRNSPSPDVLIVGAGIIGLSCAEALSRSGLRVEMWERRAAPALEASRASAGMLAPLAEVPEDRDFFDICRQARDLWLSFAPRLQEESGLPLDYDRSGALIADHPTLGLATLRAAAERGGEPWREIDGREAREWIPDLSPDIPRWLHLGGEHRVDNRRVCRALIARLRARGVILRTEHPLRGLRRDGGAAWTARGPRQTARAAHVILASGAWSRGEGTSPISGLPELPVHPVKGQMLRIEPVDWPFGGCLRCGRVYAARRTAGLDPQSPRGALLVGATVEPEARFDTAVTAGGLAQLLDFVRAAAPGLLRRPVTETWAGLRPGSADGRPLLGPLDEGLWAATGHYRNGVLLAPWSAAFIARWILEERPSGEHRSAAALLNPLRS